MGKRLVRIVIWLGVMAALTLLCMGLWLAVFKGSRTTESLKWLQLMQTAGTFLLPPVLCAMLWDENRKPFSWLGLSVTPDWKTAVLAVGTMLAAVPAINLLADLNSRIDLPESLDSIERIFRQQEETAALLTERFLQADNAGGMLLNIGLLALLPALSEELTFRGTLQQVMMNKSPITNHQLPITNHQSPITGIHISIWVTAFVFSAIHFQFYGFVPRMLMGAMFGYVFVWTGSLWVPVLMHFTNNALVVIAYYLSADEAAAPTNWADTIGAGPTWWLGVLSLVVTSLGLLIFYRRTHRQ